MKTYSESGISIIMIGIGTGKIMQELFDSFLSKYQIGLEQSIKGSNFIFDYFSLFNKRPWSFIVFRDFQDGRSH